MSFLSFYNDHHGKGNEAVIKLISDRNWQEADFAARTDPLYIGWELTIPGFFDGKIPSTCLLIHLACAQKPPASFIKTLHQIFPKGISQAESAFQRLPLHIACMNAAPTETVIRLLKSKTETAQEKDALGRLPIHYAARDLQMASSLYSLLEAYPQSARIPDRQGFLPLHVACRMGMPLDVINLLISRYPESVVSRTIKGSTPYMCAKQMGEAFLHRDEVMTLLMQCQEALPSSGEKTEDTIDTDSVVSDGGAKVSPKIMENAKNASDQQKKRLGFLSKMWRR
jgi:hypothetical protein